MYKFTRLTSDGAVRLGQGVTVDLFNQRVFVLPSVEMRPGGLHGVQTTGDCWAGDPAPPFPSHPFYNRG